MTRTLAVCAAAILAVAGGRRAVAQPAYRFINIADTNGPFNFFQSAVSISDSGVVAFSAMQDNGVNGIYTGSGGPITTIADTDGPFRTFGLPLAINANGTVAFTANYDDPFEGGGLFTSNGGEVTPIARSGIRDPLSLVTAPSINDSGTVAFYAEPRDPRMAKGIFTGNGGPLTTIADETGPIRGLVFRTSINESGTVAFQASRDVGGFGVFRGDGQTLALISTFITPGTHSSINDHGLVAFAGRSGDVRGIFAGEGGGVEILVDPPQLGVTLSPSLNNSGAVAFRGQNAAGGGIFVGGRDGTDAVIRDGAPLFNSTLFFLIDAPVMNNRGDIAFHYELANGVYGIAVAKVIPEPGGAALLIVGVLICVAPRCTRRTPRRTSA
ncbi:MAG TPA: choice-of-anchor tandem repeat NxxGxxAF-containing protein [Lacipirellula sp.]